MWIRNGLTSLADATVGEGGALIAVQKIYTGGSEEGV